MVQTWDALCQTGGTEEGGPGLGLAFSVSRTIIFGCEADPSEVIMTAGKGMVKNMSSDKSKRVGILQTPYSSNVIEAEVRDSL